MTLACICYDNNGDTRLLINHGIFLSVEECIGYILDNDLDPKIHKPYELQVNRTSMLNNAQVFVDKNYMEYYKTAKAAIYDLVDNVIGNPLLEDRTIEFYIQRATDRVCQYYPISYSLAEKEVRHIIEGHFI